MIYDLDNAYWQKKPERVIEWQDSASDAKGFLVINELINGACGGGTRVSLTTSVDELTQLAKMMQLKFTTYGPAIGGAKSGIIMDPNAPNKLDVLKRWFAFIESQLKTCYGTAADLNTDFVAIQSVLKSQGIPHPQFGIIQSIYKDPAKINQAIDRMQLLNAPVSLEGRVNAPVVQLATGFLIAELAKAAYQQKGKSLEGESVVIQGVGTVGSAAAFYLQALGAKVIGLVDKEAAVIDKDGFSAEQLSRLVATRSIQQTFTNTLTQQDFYLQIQQYPFAIFIPAGGSYLIDDALAQLLQQQQCQLILSGANVPFASQQLEKQMAKQIHVLPSYITSGGIACAFSALIQDEIRVQSAKDIFNFIKKKVNHPEVIPG
jgi:glutamate dehydrogenase/leucine dehydrogenase